MEKSAKQRETALITGASSGIGRALAYRFARGGYNLVLVARDAERLKSIADELTAAYQVEARVLAADLRIAVDAERIIRELRQANLQVDVLVNNAGFGVHGPFLETDLAEETGMVDLQLTCMLRLTKALLPAMVERRRGGVLNIASVYAFAPVAYQSVYGGCKAFLYAFTAALACEHQGSGLKFTVVCPGSTKTEFRQRAGVKEKRPGGSGLSPETVAERAFVGFHQGKEVVTPGLLDKIFILVARHLPLPAVAPLLKRINGVRGLAGKH